VEIIADNKDIRILKLTLGKWETNSYIVINPPTNKSALIDVPAGAPTIIKYLKGTELEWIILTHSHQDHTGGLKSVRGKIVAAMVLHPRDNQKWLPVKPDMDIYDKDCLMVGGLTVHVIHTPGHTPGSVALEMGKYLFAGDTVFPGGPGRTTTPEEFQKILKSITEKILPLPDNTLVLPGHGLSTTIKKVKNEYAGFAARTHSPDLCGDVTWEM
jgi:glyoxylase-like metal-dependent hydrolase (beta-lactamase superfamily II)